MNVNFQGHHSVLWTLYHGLLGWILSDGTATMCPCLVFIPPLSAGQLCTILYSAPIGFLLNSTVSFCLKPCHLPKERATGKSMQCELQLWAQPMRPSISS